MDAPLARSLYGLRVSYPEIAKALLDHFSILREGARDKFETAATDQDRLSAQVEAKTYKGLLSIFDDAVAVLKEEERKRKENAGKVDNPTGTY
jgi:hypothetical protein